LAKLTVKLLFQNITVLNILARLAGTATD